MMNPLELLLKLNNLCDREERPFDNYRLYKEHRLASSSPDHVLNEMTRRDLVLTILAAAQGRPFQPVQLQKAVFLVFRNVPGIIDEGPGFEFVPYDYGPFDSSVYSEAERLRDAGYVVIALSPSGRWKTYAASALGTETGQQKLAGLSTKIREYIEAVAGWVLGQSFGSLVKSIYEAYPEMRANSIFQE